MGGASCQFLDLRGYRLFPDRAEQPVQYYPYAGFRADSYLFSAGHRLSVLDQLGAALAVNRYAASHPRLEQLNLELEKHSDKLRQRLIAHVEKRIQRAYPTIVQPEPAAQKEKALSFGDLVWLFVIGAFLGDVVETLFCRVTAGVWMSRSSLVWGPFSVVWGLALVMAAVLLRGSEERSDRSIFLFGFVMGGAYEYICIVMPLAGTYQRGKHKYR